MSGLDDYMNWREILENMKSLTEKTEYILRQNPETRNYTGDEFISYMRRMGVNLASESITRSRRKVWEQHPQLKPTDDTYQIAKTQQEIGMIEYGRD